MNQQIVIDLVYSPDDGGYYAQEYDFSRKDHATRVSAKIYKTKQALSDAIRTEKHHWGKWG